MHWMGDQSKTLFDDKIAVTEVIRCPSDGTSDRDRDKSTDKELAWVNTTRNYLISNAGEMCFFLWAEDFQSAPISTQHISTTAVQQCMDNDPVKLRRDLWGHLNLAIPVTSGDRVAFDNAPPGKGLDAWRRL